MISHGLSIFGQNKARILAQHSKSFPNKVLCHVTRLIPHHTTTQKSVLTAATMAIHRIHYTRSPSGLPHYPTPGNILSFLPTSLCESHMNLHEVSWRTLQNNQVFHTPLGVWVGHSVGFLLRTSPPVIIDFFLLSAHPKSNTQNVCAPTFATKAHMERSPLRLTLS